MNTQTNVLILSLTSLFGINNIQYITKIEKLLVFAIVVTYYL